MTFIQKQTPITKIVMLLSLSSLLASCASQQGTPRDRVVKLEPSYLEQTQGQQQEEDSTVIDGANQAPERNSGFTHLNTLDAEQALDNRNQDLAKQFDDGAMIQIATDELPLKDWLHYVLGDVLKVNYVLDAAAKRENKAVTLNIREQMSERRLFVLVEDLLGQNGYNMNFNDDIFYVTKANSREQRGEVVYGFGKKIADVPQTSREIFQFVPLEFGVRTNYNVIMSKLTNAQLIPDFQQSVYYLRGKREDIIKALDFLNMVDRPFIQSQHLGMADLRFISPTQFVEDVSALLEREGISISTSAAQGASVAFVPIEHLGSVAIFATSETALKRVEFWAMELDKPVAGTNSSYYIYQPRLARATDMLESLAPLLGQGGFSGAQSQPVNQTANTNVNSTDRSSATRSAIGEDLKVVVDERSNALIVYSTGDKYQQLLPLLKRMDVMPKQVMLEVLIAEVLLRDEFAQGVEFFFNNGNYTLGNQGSTGLGDIGGLSYVLTGSSRWDVNAKLEEKDSLINVISRPSLVVRDGVTAQLQVGTDIPIVTSTSSPDVGTTTSVQYRKTGLTLSVKPTVNSRGIVIMEISQQVSNVLSEGVTAEGAPSIFDRTMSTEVVANSGQTVILGGLISENTTNGETKVPGFGDIPLLGNLFTTKSENTEKTELVILVTPRVIDSSDQWEGIKNQFRESMSQLEF